MLLAPVVSILRSPALHQTQCGASVAVLNHLRFLMLNSEGHSAPALLPGSHLDLPGSLKTALKRTRPRQRIWILLVSIL